MGRQINFFMAESDELDFLDAVHGMGGAFLSFRQPRMGHVSAVDILPPQTTPFAHEMSIARQQDVPKITTNSFTVGEFWLLDENNDDLIQFRRSRVSNLIISSGRLWIDTCRAVWDPVSQEESLVRKSAQFVEFYDAIARWIRREYSKCDANGFWVAPAAKAASSSGIKLTEEH
jgi:hypothetical protein